MQIPLFRQHPAKSAGRVRAPQAAFGSLRQQRGKAALLVRSALRNERRVPAPMRLSPTSPKRSRRFLPNSTTRRYTDIE